MRKMPIFLLLLLGISNGAAFELRPQNTLVKVGQDFELTCTYLQQKISWYHSPFTITGFWSYPRLINRGYNMSFNLYGDIRGQRLSVSSARVEHAGIYVCIVMTESGINVNASAALSVIAGDPMCEMKSKATLMEKERIDLLCIFSHHGPIKPVVVWKQRTGNGWKEMNFTLSNTMWQTSCQLSEVADLTMHQAKFEWELSFIEMSSVKSYPEIANNTPSYSYHWPTPIVNIIHGPLHLTINPPDGILDFGDHATCSADGFPTPIIKWIHSNTGKIILGSNLSTDAILAGKEEGSSIFMCRATNVNTFRTANINFTFQIRDDDHEHSMNTYSTEQHTNTAHTTTMKDLKTENPLARFLVPSFAVSLGIICGLVFYIMSRKRRKQKKDLRRVKAILADIRANQKISVSRVSQNTFPQCVAKVQPLDHTDYLSPRSDLMATNSSEYDEIPAMHALSIDNNVYFDIPANKETRSSAASASVPPLPALPRSCNDYMDVSYLELQFKDGIYETLQKN